MVNFVNTTREELITVLSDELEGIFIDKFMIVFIDETEASIDKLIKISENDLKEVLKLISTDELRRDNLYTFR